MKAYFFKPIYQERIWGGQGLASFFGRELPSQNKIGESWELVDRPEACSEVIEGPNLKEDATITLHDLWIGRRKEIFGSRAPDAPRFPILIKLLDCQENLSVQVHPPLGQEGEPKTEMWYLLETAPNALIYAGLKKGVTRAQFEKAIGTPGLPPLLHALPTQAGETMFLPSGRVHAIGGGNLILEIQQNSDTTYRVDDWNRVDEKGQPRTLHREQALASIRFDDYEPQFAQPHGEKIVQCPFFTTERAYIYPGEYRTAPSDPTSFRYHFIAQGELKVGARSFKRGDHWLVPANEPPYEMEPLGEGAEVVTVTWGK